MAYVPPHKRLSTAKEGPPPTPEQLITPFKKSFNLCSSRFASDRGKDKNVSGTKVVYAAHSISRWLAAPLTDDGLLPSSVHLVPVSVESTEWTTREKPFALVKDCSEQEDHDSENCCLKSPWASVAETVHSDLLSAIENVRNVLVDHSFEEIKPTLVARFGKLLFHRDREPMLKFDLVSESELRNLRRVFYTSLTTSYMEHIRSEVVQKLGVRFEGSKELYRVKLAKGMRSYSTISCKCRVQKGEKKLELYKIELSPVRHLQQDISCLDNCVDLRLALYTKRISLALSDDEKQTISDIVSSAILDPNLKGGLRWPLGKANSGGQFSVNAVWHTKTEAYSSSAVRLKVREANRYDFSASTGEVAREAVLKLTGITRNLLDQRSEAVEGLKILEDALKLIWNHFLAWNHCLVS